MSPPADLREAAIWLAERELGRPYRWGGDDPLEGWDCSGLVNEIAIALNRLPRGDRTAATLSTLFPTVTTPQRGHLVFWNRRKADGSIYIGHVEMVWAVIDGEVFTIGAAGGGSATTSADAAAKQNAFVKIRPLTPGWVKVVDPWGAR